MGWDEEGDADDRSCLCLSSGRGRAALNPFKPNPHLIFLLYMETWPEGSRLP